MGALKLLQIHFKTAQNSGFFFVRGRENGQDKGYVTPRHQRGPKGECKVSKSLYSQVCWPLEVWGQFWDTCKSLPKDPVSSRIPLIINIPIAGAIPLRAMREMRARIKVETEKASILLLHLTANPIHNVLAFPKDALVTVTLGFSLFFL